MTVVDGGDALEPHRIAVVNDMARLIPDRWTPSQIATVKEAPDRAEIPLKTSFGSLFPYDFGSADWPSEYEAVGLRPSLAIGGLSNVWGATLLPYRQADLSAWPITVAELSKHYAAVEALTGISACRDDLEEIFPIHAPNTEALMLGRQARALKKWMEGYRAQLQQEGIVFGQARVAVKAGSEGCNYCGFCMYGCPYGHIYNTSATLHALVSRGVEHRAGIRVTDVADSADFVRVRGYERKSGEPIEFEARRVYVAAGALGSMRILLKSQKRYDTPVVMKDSQYFLAPLLLRRSAGDVRLERSNTLSQIFLEILDSELCQQTIHLQIYGHNEIVGRSLRQSLGWLARPLEALVQRIENRAMVIQGYLHSDVSPSITVTLARPDSKGSERLHVRTAASPAARKLIDKVFRKLAGQSRRLGAFPLGQMVRIAEAGRGFHSGGTYPMTNDPSEYKTDTLGRPGGWRRVHVVDSSIFPTIPATTITFTVMANAHRIGVEAAGLD